MPYTVGVPIHSGCAHTQWVCPYTVGGPIHNGCAQTVGVPIHSGCAYTVGVLVQSVCLYNGWISGVHTGFTVLGGGGGGGTQNVWCLCHGVHKQAPSRGIWAPPPPPLRFFLQNRCSQIDSDTVASCHRIYTIIIRKANHRIIAHGQNILD